ncbi:MAG: leucine-rich repeat domain-containing protein [Lachnospiraceae bacterium]|nr:leucine-rich repeat domain-containing protein [Lachnospiraceae bacterium]
MKRSMKKFVAFIAFLAIAIQMFAMPGVEANAAASDFEVSWGTVYYVGSDKKVNIPAMTDAASLYISENSTIEELSIAEGYNSVYIYNCPSLKSVKIPASADYIYMNYDEGIESLTIPKNAQSVSLYALSSLKNVTFEKNGVTECSNITVSSCPQIKSVDLPNRGETVEISYCDKIETVNVGAKTEYLYLYDLPAAKKINLPKNLAYFSIRDVAYSALTDDSDRFDIENDCIYDGDILFSLDPSKKVINVRPGTIETSYLGISGSCYVTTINLPDSVEKIGEASFAGMYSLKNVNLPKNLVTISAYAFDESSIKSITIPENVAFISPEAFCGYTGSVKVSDKNPTFSIYDDCLYGTYLDYSYDNNSPMYKSILYYVPKNKTSIKFDPNIVGIESFAFTDTKLKEINVPEGVTYMCSYLSGSAAKKITLPASLTYTDNIYLRTSDNLEKIVVSPDNSFFASYNNCLYTKDYSYLYVAPKKLSNVKIHKDCLSAADYALANNYYDGEEKEMLLTVTFPKNFVTLGYYNIDIMRVYADSPMAEIIDIYNNVTLPQWFDPEFDPDYAYYRQNYELIDSNDEILNQIYVQDVVTVSAKKKAQPNIILPFGLTSVKKLGNSNTEVVLKYSSSNKEIAKVSSTTGKITGVKKGTCTVNVKATITNGKKKTTKTFKIAVKVK